MLFNMFMKFGFLPNDFCPAVIIPLVKNKNGNLTDVNNYRAIAIFNAVSKLLEDIMYRFSDSTDSNNYISRQNQRVGFSGCSMHI